MLPKCQRDKPFLHSAYARFLNQCCDMSVTKVRMIDTFKPFIDILPIEHHDEATKILKAIMPTLDIQDRIVYNNGIIGSNIVDLLKYYFDHKLDRPADFNKFEVLANQKLGKGKRWLHLL